MPFSQILLKVGNVVNVFILYSCCYSFTCFIEFNSVDSPLIRHMGEILITILLQVGIDWLHRRLPFFNYGKWDMVQQTS